MVHIVGKVYENEPELLACVAVGLGNHVDVLNAAVAVCVRTEKLTENSLHIVRVELVVNARKAQRRDSNHSVGSHDSQERERERNITQWVLNDVEKVPKNRFQFFFENR